MTDEHVEQTNGFESIDDAVVDDAITGPATSSNPRERKFLTAEQPLFCTPAEIMSAKKPSFFISGFLLDTGVTALAALPGNRKTRIAWNVVCALLTGKPLFGHFPVAKQPSRVLYLSPEQCNGEIKEHVTGLGLTEYLNSGKLLVRTVDVSGKLWLNDARLREFLPGAVVVADTLIRFLDGNESVSSDMAKFSEEVFGLLRDGAACVLALHHSGKTARKTDELTLENCLRGSGEIGAFVAAAWGTKLNGDGEDDRLKPSLLVCVKQRHFYTQSFEVQSSETGLLTLRPDSFGAQLLPPNRANKDAKDAQRLEFMAAHPDMKPSEIVKELKRLGMSRGITWVRQQLCEIRGTGVANIGAGVSGTQPSGDAASRGTTRSTNVRAIRRGSGSRGSRGAAIGPQWWWV